MGSEPLQETNCEFCGAKKIPGSYWHNREEWWYYDHTYPSDCLRFLRMLIDDIGSRRIV